MACSVLMTSAYLGAYPEWSHPTKDVPSALITWEFTRVLGALYQEWSQRPNIRTREAHSALLTWEIRKL